MTRTSTPDPQEPAWPRTVDLTTPGRTARPGPTTMSELTARAAQAAASQREELAAMAACQMRELAQELTRQASSHVTDYNRQLSAALRSTRASTDSELAALQAATTRTARRIRRSMLCPPITATLLSALILASSALLGWDLAHGIPATTITTKTGKTMQVLTEPGWKTCQPGGRERPCRRINK